LTAFIPHIRSSVDTLLERSRALLPSGAMRMIEPHLRGLVATAKPHLLTLGRQGEWRAGPRPGTAST